MAMLIHRCERDGAPKEWHTEYHAALPWRACPGPFGPSELVPTFAPKTSARVEQIVPPSQVWASQSLGMRACDCDECVDEYARLTGVVCTCDRPAEGERVTDAGCPLHAWKVAPAEPAGPWVVEAESVDA